MVVFVCESGDVFAEVLRGAVSARGLSLERVRYHLAVRGHDVSAATLSYWQSGRSRPERSSSIAALGDLEDVLGVDEGVLVDALARARGRPVPVLAVCEEQSRDVPIVNPMLWGAGHSVESERVREGLARGLGTSFDDVPAMVSEHVEVMLRRDRSVGSLRVRLVVGGASSGVLRFPIAVHAAGGAGDLVFVVERGGVVDGVVSSSDGHALSVASIRLDAPVGVGECAVVDVRVDRLSAGADEGMFSFLSSSAELLVVMGIFCPGDEPLAMSVAARWQGRSRVSRVSVKGERQVMMLSEVDAGPVGVSWWW
ncbi:hypothetical protein [Dermatophilus congolensis]|uniref:hypothetical protein n=1 Tax=Dermatophilus congolensis TaxID=1863 RepID=UPI001AAE6E9D|nr:hypothetical protein [Dermatophilus congolensis]MBO3141962.1 hypothetical protein [Dermatophilus congolensis]MBO3150954.1 hypothetical protein [Dermatophilus congolensis]